MATDFNTLITHGGARYVANPASHHTTAITSRPASSKDVLMTLSAANTEILDMLAAEYAPHEFADVAVTLGYSERELAEYDRQEKTGEISPHEAYFKVFFLAEIVSSLIQHRATVDHIGILQATEAELDEWEPYYLETAREVFSQMVEVEKTVNTGSVASNAAWRELYAGEDGFQRQAYLCSQTQLRLGRFRVEVANAAD